MINKKSDELINELLLGVQREEVEEYEKRYLSETKSCPSMSRLETLALKPSQMTAPEREHVGDCAHCQSRFKALQQELHPSLFKLVQMKLGLLEGDEALYAQSHLNEGCEQCGQLLSTSLIEKIVSATERGRQTLTQLKGVLSHALYGLSYVPEQSWQYANRKDFRQSFAEYFEQDELTVTMEATEGNELFVRVATTDAALQNHYVQLEIKGERKTLSALIKLEGQSGCYDGVHYFSDFSQLMDELGKIVVLVIPDYEEPQIIS